MSFKLPAGSFSRTLKWLLCVAVWGVSLMLFSAEILCEGAYSAHLQGLDADGNGIYWSFTGTLVKTDLQGKKQLAVKVPPHHGDLCVRAGKVYVAVCRGQFNALNPKGKNFVYCYNAKTLKLEKRFPVDEMIYGAGGITDTGTGFLVVGGLPDDVLQNLAAEYTYDFKLKRLLVMPWHSFKGIQTAMTLNDGNFVFGVYDKKPARTKICSPDGAVLQSQKKLCTSYGICRLPDGRLYVAVNTQPVEGGRKKWGAKLRSVKLQPDGQWTWEK